MYFSNWWVVVDIVALQMLSCSKNVPPFYYLLLLFIYSRIFVMFMGHFAQFSDRILSASASAGHVPQTAVLFCVCVLYVRTA